MKSARYKPLIFSRIDEYQEFISQQNKPVLINELHKQLKELVIVRNPQIPLKGEKEAIDSYINEHLAGQNIDEYGCWVYYPWINTVVRTLPEDEFIEVRTNRNKYKITEEEFKTLQSKTIGIVGLSVGRAVAMTAAMERICGRMRIADFDTLELSNLNRIHTDLLNLGLNKALSVAREIALIDPFLEVELFDEGLTEENMPDFLGLNGNKLNMLVEACDDLEIKIISRFKARENGIPVIMEASDRCVVDVERFDLEPDRPILHNLLGDINIEKLKAIKTDEEKIPILLALNGNEALSPRIRASAIEISQTINTWPQLASAVTLGGGVVTDVIRRIFIDEFRSSGRFYVDVHQLINDRGDRVSEYQPIEHAAGGRLTKESMVEMANGLAPGKDKNLPPKDDLEFIIAEGHKAPSGGNSQPWVWMVKDSELLLFHDRALSDSFLDYDYDASRLAFGAATENMKLAAADRGWNLNYELFPGPDQKLIARYSFEQTNETGYRSHLSESISDRSTNRKILMSAEIEDQEYERLQESIAGIPGAKLQIIKDYDQRVDIGNMMGAMDRVRVLFKDTHEDMVRELRWNQNEAQATKDGIDVATLDMPESILAGLHMVKDKRVIDLLKSWDKGYALEGLMQYYAMFSDSICMISHEDIGDATFFEGGRAVERAWLQASHSGISFQPISACLFLFNRYEKEGEKPFGEFGPAVTKAYEDYAKHFKIKENEKRVFIFRLFKGEGPSVRALRRDLSEHLIYA